jgi:LPPG:FO 2-phospho-L-lactate transferase
VGGAVVRGMADRLLPAAGSEVSAVAVAARYADFLDAWLIDEADAKLVDDIAASGVRCAATDTIMRYADVAADVARAALELLKSG